MLRGAYLTILRCVRSQKRRDEAHLGSPWSVLQPSLRNPSMGLVLMPWSVRGDLQNQTRRQTSVSCSMSPRGDATWIPRCSANADLCSCPGVGLRRLPGHHRRITRTSASATLAGLAHITSPTSSHACRPQHPEARFGLTWRAASAPGPPPHLHCGILYPAQPALSRFRLEGGEDIFDVYKAMDCVLQLEALELLGSEGHAAAPPHSRL